MSFQYNETEALNAKSSYGENDVCDFMIQDTADMDLVANSVVLTFDLKVEEPSGTRALNKQIFFNPNAGAHAYIDSVNVSTNLGQLEHISEYSRMVAMFETASKADNDTFNTSDACEMISTDQEQSTGYCEGNTTDGTGSSTHITEDCDVALKPRCVLNKMSANLPFSKVGFVKLSVTLAKVIDALFSNETAPNMNYVISNLKCRYKTAPTQNQKVVMRSVIGLKTSINSSNANISAKVPGVANKYVTYPLKDRAEILKNFVESIAETGHNRIHSNYWKGDHMGIGLNWGQMVDLSQQKFNIQIKSNDISNTNPYLVNMYFHSVVSI
jgi:hypothetical protein